LPEYKCYEDFNEQDFEEMKKMKVLWMFLIILVFLRSFWKFKRVF